MSRKNRGKVRRTRYTDYERWVGLPHFMLKSVAWAGRQADAAAGVAAVTPLSPNAKAILIAVWQRFNGINNSEISYAVREAAAIDVTKNRAKEAFDELVERGFLRVSANSSFDQKRLSRTWILTALPMPDGTKGTNDFMSWRPDNLQSRPRDYETDPKNKTQSRPRDAQSRPRDYDHENATKLPATVPPTGLSDRDSAPLQSRPRDTSILPCGVAGGVSDAAATVANGSVMGEPSPAPAKPAWRTPIITETTIGALIRERRLSLGWRPSRMARRLQLSGEELRAIEAGSTNIIGDAAATIVDRLLAIS